MLEEKLHEIKGFKQIIEEKRKEKNCDDQVADVVTGELQETLASAEIH